jgi:hypothetical protein
MIQYSSAFDRRVLDLVDGTVRFHHFVQFAHLCDCQTSFSLAKHQGVSEALVDVWQQLIERQKVFVRVLAKHR